MLKSFVLPLVLCALTSTSLALEPLPSELEGTWTAIGATGSTPGNGKVSMRIKDQSGGAVKGDMNWEGGRTCEMRGAPMTGTWNGTTLVVSAAYTSPVAFAWCAGPAEFVIKRVANGKYEGGTDRFPNTTVTISLSPKSR